MTATYDKIATYTLPSSTSSYTFTSIAGTYTDLVLICGIQGGSGTGVGMQFNSDTGTNYSNTRLIGDGSTASSARTSNSGNARIAQNGYSSGDKGVIIVNLQNYSNTTTNKTSITRNNIAVSATEAIVNLWRNTAAITSITIFGTTGSLETGTTFTLYGIKAE
jgi:hypothetical protein